MYALRDSTSSVYGYDDDEIIFHDHSSSSFFDLDAASDEGMTV